MVCVILWRKSDWSCVTGCSLVEIFRRFRGTWNHNEGSSRLLRNYDDFFTRLRSRRHSCAISGFRREIYENRALLRYYAASCGNFLPSFRLNVSVPSSRVKNLLKMEPIGCPETSVRNYFYSLSNGAGGRSSRWHSLSQSASQTTVKEQLVIP